MEFIKFALFTFLVIFSVGSARANCVIIAEDPVIQQFLRAKGFQVDDEKGNFRVEFEVTCEVKQTMTKIEVFNQYENAKVVYHTNSLVHKTTQVESGASVVPCVDTREMKAKLLETSLSVMKELNCEEEE